MPLLKLGIVTQSSYSVKKCFQEASPKSSVGKSIDIEKMIIDIAAELEDMPYLEHQQSTRLGSLLHDTDCVRFYKAPFQEEVASRYYLDNWIDMAVSHSDLGESKFEESGLSSELHSSKVGERMFELGLMSLKGIGIDEYHTDKLTGKISSRGNFDMPKIIKQELDKTTLPEAAEDLMIRTTSNNLEDRADLNQVTRAYSRRRTRAEMTQNMIDSAIKRYFEREQSSIIKDNGGKAWEASTESMLEEVKRGESQGQWTKGVIHHLGIGAEKDYKQAVRGYRLAADAGHTHAQNNLGYIYQNGLGVEKDYKEAVRLYRLAADKGSAEAQNNLGIMYQNGLSVEKDYDEAIRLYRLAADSGNVRAQSNLGIMYQDGLGLKKDYDEAIRLYRLAADAEHITAQYSLGDTYRYGEGVEKSNKEGLRIHLRASDATNAAAQCNIGLMYENGLIVEKDKKEAMKMYRLASDAGNTVAHLKLGLLHKSGNSVVKDHKEAVRLFRLSADAGNSNAQSELGVMYLNGLGIKKDLREAERRFQLAANAGHSLAQHYLGTMYLFGLGVTGCRKTKKKV